MKKCILRLTLLLICLLLSMQTGFAAAFVVKQGSRGAHVRKVQELLIEKGYLAAGEADGICGNRTAGAIRKFQTAEGLEADGVCGEATYRALSGGQEPPEMPAVQPMSTASAPAGARSLFVTAFAYSPEDPGMGSHTASGTLLRRGVIAVDPAVIPMGTRVFIPGYGEAVAEDIGGNIRGNVIDIAFDTHYEAIMFGRQNIEIFILN
ncbi:hypothetical protein TAMA11512_15850 [Selenomonas sp. TAMA-11512]|uniref:3D domain-containing protein n=1 Tax=Selenomonas sp. TAMA-11512 TaxID=3095337 RepID=UPI003085CB76|nr:hypothetical protein TAMA11512_15850 [Selenomonas sp. TAMA-11512]